ncbi:MAG TPA: site-specific DNA-methyltransferase [Candidatus Limihabitans stercoravium]|nr:site-specific DNA-methyltransferase [Candidatus Limihabitans stercoravium]
MYIEGDNLEVLKLLQTSYLNSVKMIYIDPPYNTGHDFVYNDSFADPISQYKEVTGQATRSNPETAGRYHTNWLNMMYPRLKLARNLLTDDGVIFISIDDNEQANLKKICDEVFGEDNFVAVFPWRKRTAKSDVPFGVSQDYEWIMAYARSQNFIAAIEGGTRKYFTTPDFPGRPWRIHDLTKQTSASERPKSFFTLVNPKTGKEYPANPNRTWAITKDTFEGYYKQGKIVFPDDYDFLNITQPAFRYFKDDDEKKAGEKFGCIAVSTNLPKEIGMTKDGTAEITELFEKKVFSFSKPVALLKFLISITTKFDKDAIVLDFFSGSATTAHAVMQLNAEDGGNIKFICVQLPEKTDEQSEAYKAGYTNICEIGKERIRRAGEKIKQDNKDKQGIENLDIGFKVFKLDSSNLVKWDNTPTTDVEEVKKRVQQSLFYLVEGREDIDLVYEVMLKRGLPLTSTVEECVFDGVKAFFVNSPSDKMLICLDPVTISAVEKMAESTAEVCIFADRCFADANILSNTDEILKKKDKKVEMF